uniref:Uncharacterized protein n=1 Tax=Oryza nivara TaxID=4536 RepID=A0A0E0I9I2_ORYNI
MSHTQPNKSMGSVRSLLHDSRASTCSLARKIANAVTMDGRMSRWRRFTSDEWRWLDFFKGLPCMHVFRVREVHATGLGLTREGEIKNGARRPVVEDDADLQDHCAIGWGTWGYMERGRHEADGVVVWLATVHCSQNDNDVKAATRRARSKAGDDTWRSRRSATQEDGIKRKIFGMISDDARRLGHGGARWRRNEKEMNREREEEEEQRKKD